MIIKSLKFICNGKKIPGTLYQMYMVSACEVESFPAYKVTTDVGDSITLDGNIELKPNKIWKTVDIISDTGKISHSSVGFRNAKNFLNRLDFKLQKDIASDEWFDRNINFRGIVLIKEKDGAFRVFGNLDVPATINFAEGTTGAKNSDERSWIGQIVDKVGRVNAYYDGAIQSVPLGSFSNAFNQSFN